MVEKKKSSKKKSSSKKKKPIDANEEDLKQSKKEDGTKPASKKKSRSKSPKKIKSDDAMKHTEEGGKSVEKKPASKKKSRSKSPKKNKSDDGIKQTQEGKTSSKTKQSSKSSPKSPKKATLSPKKSPKSKKKVTISKNEDEVFYNLEVEASLSGNIDINVKSGQPDDMDLAKKQQVPIPSPLRLPSHHRSGASPGISSRKSVSSPVRVTESVRPPPLRHDNSRNTSEGIMSSFSVGDYSSRGLMGFVNELARIPSKRSSLVVNDYTSRQQTTAAVVTSRHRYIGRGLPSGMRSGLPSGL